jgi:peptidyl-prolyl cis-trans isomerase D
MLQAIRSRAASLVVKVLFGMLILSFGVWGIGDIFRNRAPDTVVATVGNETIDASALQNALQPALERLRLQTGGTVDLEQAKKLGVVDRVLDELIDRGLADQETGRLRLDVSDEAVRNIISHDPTFRGQNGAFDRAAFNSMLAANHMSEGQYVATTRREIAARDLFGAITSGAAAPPTLVDALYQHRNETRVADIVTLPATGGGDVGQPTDAQLEAFYNAHKDLFRAPEYRSFTLESLSPSELAQSIEIPEAKLKEQYDQRHDDFVVPERRDVQQILAPTEAKAKEAAAALAAGKDWNEVATTIVKQAPDTIDLGLMKREEMPRALAEVAFSLPLDKPSAPVKSPLGWHILRVVKIEPPATQSFAQAKAKLQADLARDQAVDRIYKIADKVDDALAGGATLEEAGAKLKLKKTVVPAVDQQGLGRDGKKVELPVAADEVLKLAFATNQGQTSRVTETKGDAVFVLRTDKVVPPATKPLSEVKAAAIAAWQADARREHVAKEAKELAEAVKPGMKLATVAAAKGLKAVTSTPFLRRPGPGETVPPVLVGKLFGVKPGGVVTASDGNGDYVAQLDKIEAPDAGKASAAAKAELARELDAGLQAGLAAEYTQALRSRFPVTVHHETLDRLF